MSVALAVDFAWHIELDGSCLVEFASPDDLARGTSLGAWLNGYRCEVVDLRLRQTSVASLLTKDEFREIVEVFRILKRWRDEEGG